MILEKTKELIKNITLKCFYSFNQRKLYYTSEQLQEIFKNLDLDGLKNFLDLRGKYLSKSDKSNTNFSKTLYDMYNFRFDLHLKDALQNSDKEKFFSFFNFIFTIPEFKDNYLKKIKNILENSESSSYFLLANANPEYLKFLIADKKFKIHSENLFIALNKNIDNAANIIQYCEIPNAILNIVFVNAVQFGHLKILKSLLDKKMKPNFTDLFLLNVSLHEAENDDHLFAFRTACKNKEVFELLLDFGFNLKDFNFSQPEHKKILIANFGNDYYNEKLEKFYKKDYQEIANPKSHKKIKI